MVFAIVGFLVYHLLPATEWKLCLVHCRISSVWGKAWLTMRHLLDNMGSWGPGTSDTTAAAACSAQDSSPTECPGVKQVTPVIGCCINTNILGYLIVDSFPGGQA